MKRLRRLASSRYAVAISSSWLAVGISAVVQLVRVPIILDHLSVAQFGVLLTLTTVAAVAFIPGRSLRQALITHFGESVGTERAKTSTAVADGSTSQPSQIYGAGKYLVRRIQGWSLAVGLLLSVIPLSFLFDPDGAIGRWQLHIAIAITAVMVISAYAGSVRNAVLDTAQHVGLLNSVSVLASLISLVGVLVSALLDLGFLGFYTSAMLALAAPAWLTRFTWRKAKSKVGLDSCAVTFTARQVTTLRTNFRKLLFVAIAATGATGLDLVIVSAFLGSEDASLLGLTVRIGIPVMLIATSLQSLVWTRLAIVRGAGGIADVRRTLTRELSVQTTLALSLSVGVVAFGPWVANLLTRGEIVPSRGLFAVYCTAAVLQLISGALLAAATGANAMTMRTVLAVGAAVLNLLLSLVLVQFLGVAGPVVATAIAAFLLNVILIVWFARRPHVLTKTH